MASQSVKVGTSVSASQRMNTVTGTGPWNITLAGAIAGLAFGDVFTQDNNGRFWNVTAVTDLQHFEVTDTWGMGAGPDELQDGHTGRHFSTIGAAEAATPNIGLGAGDTYTITCYNDGAITEAPITFNDATLGATGTLKLTVADSEWHQGVPGSGFTWQQSVEGTSFNFAIASASCPTQTIERLEILGITVTTTVSYGILMSEDGTKKTTIKDCIIRDYVTNGGLNPSIFGIFVNSGAANGVKVENCLVYNLTATGGSTGARTAYRFDAAAVEVYNCNAYNANLGFQQVGTTPLVKNCAAFGTATKDFSVGSGWHASSTNNASSDTTAPGSNAQKSLTDTDEFVDVANGDFNLLKTSNLRNNGVAISGLTTDLTGRARGATPDIGAYEFPEWRGRRLGGVSLMKDFYPEVF